MHEENLEHTRPATPESPLTSSLHHATSTIDDLTLALTNFSRVPSPEPQPPLACCCGREDCENTRNWLSFKSRLESRLILSAEVGQALLKRHEAYVRQHEHAQDPPNDLRNPDIHVDDDSQTNESTDSRIADLISENVQLEKRLARTLVNNEVAEASNKTLLQELEEARDAVSRLTALHARSVGWDTRLTTAMQEKDDMRQERDSEAQKARLAEVRIAALKDRSVKLQAEVRRLQEDLEQRRLHRLESSESILQDARARLEKLQHPQQSGNSLMIDNVEVTKVLEDLVADNETLKRDNAELQHLLTDSREDVRALQEEVEEQRATLPSQPPETPRSRHLFPTSVPSSITKDRSSIKYGRRPASAEPRNRHSFEFLTPETDRRPLSPADSLTPSETKWTAFSQPQPRYPSSHISFEIDDDGQRDNEPSTPEKPRGHKPLFLLTRSTGVQTDNWPGLLAPSSPMPSTLSTHVTSSSSHDGRSESSSLLDSASSQSSHMTTLVERVVGLLHRITQADALTLTNRLKRQHLKGADVGHLSRTTVGAILSEASNLRSQFRALLEDEKMVTTCTRKDLRGLFNLFRDLFMELGQMRVTLNDVILDPSVAHKVRDMAMNPSKAEAAERGRNADSSTAGGWMAPISKLFGSPGDGSQASRVDSPQQRSGSRGRGAVRAPGRVVPKIGPALSASTTTVNVEFSGMGVGRSVTSTFSAHPEDEEARVDRIPSATSPPPSNNVSKNVMGIFAGAPRAPDSWIVVPTSSQDAQTPKADAHTYNTATIGRSALRNAGKSGRMSRQVDAVIDVDTPQSDEPDFQPALLERTLRRRGLSDSSIRSTFMNQSDEPRPPHASMHDSLSPRETWPEGRSVLKAFTRTVQSFRFAATNTLSGAAGSVPDVFRTAVDPSSPGDVETVPRLSSPTLSGLVPKLPSWTIGGSAPEPSASSEPHFIGSPREDSFSHRTQWARETQGRNF